MSSSDSTLAKAGISRVLAWVKEQGEKAAPLSDDDVPGADEVERRELRVLGGLARALGESTGLDYSEWPEDVLAWMDSAPTPPRSLVSDILGQLSADDELLGRIYEQLVAGENRRHLGTFFTPTAVLDYMERVVASDPATVVDPGAGVGAFTAAALRRWPAAQAHAVDINLVTLGLLAAHPGLSEAVQDDARLRLHHSDFIRWMRHEFARLQTPKLIFGNPPYTRHQLLKAEYKERLEGLRAEWNLGSRAGLSTYFLVTSLGALGEKDCLCLLLPANWLEADYAEHVRSYIWDLKGRQIALHLFPNEDKVNIFPTAQVAAMILWVGPASKAGSLTLYPVSKAGETFNRGRGLRVNRSNPCPPVFTIDTLAASRSKAMRLSASETTPSRPGTISLGDIATIRRGVATGGNSFFLLKDEEVASLPRHVVVPAIARLRELDVDDLDVDLHAVLGSRGERRWLLNLTVEDQKNDAVAKLLNSPAGQEVRKGYLCSTRRPEWFVLEQIAIPDILLSPMSKGRFRVAANSAGAIPTNTLYGIRLKDSNQHPDAIKRLVTWLASDPGQSALLAVSRQHGDGLRKLEPRALLRVRVPDDLVELCAADS